ncbi:MAG TPA: type I 3-dehydroquinate dehydratase, partial [bacterium]|nr:type I 3-dehydroquinate dehydratase [bacterium]
MVEQLALVLVGGEKERLLQTRLPQAGWVELRVDRFLSVFPREDLTGWVKQVRRHFSGRLVATVRWFKEQAAPVNRLTESEREKFYRILLPEVDYLDVELRSCLARKMVGQAHQQNRKVILSSHYFMSCPGNSALSRLYRRFR